MQSCVSRRGIWGIRRAETEEFKREIPAGAQGAGETVDVEPCIRTASIAFGLPHPPGAAVCQGQPLKPLSARRAARMELKGGARMELEVTGKMEQERTKRRMERYMALSNRKLKREKGGNRHGNITSVCGRGRRGD